MKIKAKQTLTYLEDRSPLSYTVFDILHQELTLQTMSSSILTNLSRLLVWEYLYFQENTVI